VPGGGDVDAAELSSAAGRGKGRAGRSGRRLQITANRQGQTRPTAVRPLIVGAGARVNRSWGFTPGPAPRHVVPSLGSSPPVRSAFLEPLVGPPKTLHPTTTPAPTRGVGPACGPTVQREQRAWHQRAYKGRPPSPRTHASPTRSPLRPVTVLCCCRGSLASLPPPRRTGRRHGSIAREPRGERIISSLCFPSLLRSFPSFWFGGGGAIGFGLGWVGEGLAPVGMTGEWRGARPVADTMRFGRWDPLVGLVLVCCFLWVSGSSCGGRPLL
jgi:hypothetical protein